MDALTVLLESEPESAHVVIVQSQRPDRFFGAAEQARLTVLMQRFHDAQAGKEALSKAERAELEGLIEVELEASGKRVQALAAALR